MLKFNDYLLLEKVLTYSDQFISILSTIDSKLSNYLMSIVDTDIDKLIQTNIDINIDKKDSIIFDNSGRKQEMKIGRLVKTILTLNKNKDFKDTDIEDFTKAYKAIMDKTDLKFELVSGSDILAGYDTENYSDESFSELGESCMNDKFDYLKIYENNKNIELLTIKEYFIGDDDYGYEGGYKIVGRALVWNTTSGFKFMDRIYYTHVHYLIKIQKWASINKMYYKRDNISTDSDFIICGPDGSEKLKSLEVILDNNINNYDKFPYMDSFCYGSGRHLYTNSDGLVSYSKFKDIYGGYDNEDNGIEDINGEYVSEDDCYFSEYHDAYIQKDDPKLTIIRYYIAPFKIITEYIYDIENQDDLVYCNIDNKWYFKEDCEWSNFSNSYVMKYNSHYIMKDWVHSSMMKEFYDANPDLKNPFIK